MKRWLLLGSLFVCALVGFLPADAQIARPAATPRAAATARPTATERIPGEGIGGALVGDTFEDRAIGSNLNGTLTTTGGIPWSVYRGTVLIEDTAGGDKGVYCSSNEPGSMLAFFDSGYSDNVDASYVLNFVTEQAFHPVWRAASDTTFYEARPTQTGTTVWRADNAGFSSSQVFTSGAAEACINALGETFEVKLRGNTHYLYLRGVQFGSFTDATYNTGEGVGVTAVSGGTQPTITEIFVSSAEGP